MIPSDLWSDADVCWLTGAHIADDHTYLVREPFEELLWWMQLPDLLRLAASPSPMRADAEAISERIDQALVALGEAGYRLNALLGAEPAMNLEPGPEHASEAPQSVRKCGKIDDPAPDDVRPREPVVGKPVGPTNS